jgi:hypothetical protein
MAEPSLDSPIEEEEEEEEEEEDTECLPDTDVHECQPFLPVSEEQMKSPTFHLHKVAFAFVALVVLQVFLALSFKFAQRGMSGQYPFSSPALLVIAEITKLGISLCLFFQEESYTRVGHATKEELATKKAFENVRQSFLTLGGELTFPLLRNTALLAALYCVNNHIAFLVFRMADGANITLIKSGSSFVCALMLRFALGRAISRVQWSAIFLQIFGLVVAQFGATCSNTPILPGYAYLLLFISLVISSVSSVWNDQLLKHDNNTSMHIINMLLYAFGFLMNGISYVYTAGPDRGFFSGFDKSATFLVLICQSLFGVTISAVYKFSDAWENSPSPAKRRFKGGMDVIDTDHGECLLLVEVGNGSAEYLHVKTCLLEEEEEEKGDGKGQREHGPGHGSNRLWAWPSWVLPGRQGKDEEAAQHPPRRREGHRTRRGRQPLPPSKSEEVNKTRWQGGNQSPLLTRNLRPA